MAAQAAFEGTRSSQKAPYKRRGGASVSGYGSQSELEPSRSTRLKPRWLQNDDDDGDDGSDGDDDADDDDYDHYDLGNRGEREKTPQSETRPSPVPAGSGTGRGKERHGHRT